VADEVDVPEVQYVLKLARVDRGDREVLAAVRAAQVAILREVAAKIKESMWTSRDKTLAVVARSIALQIAETIEAKATELGAGGGQTEEAQGDG